MKEYDTTIKALESLRVQLLRGLQERSKMKVISSPDSKDIELTAKVELLEVNDYPVFSFIYKGSLPIYLKKDDKETTDYHAEIRNHYFISTLDAYNFRDNPLKFDKAILIIEHYFSNAIIRDLDNRNRKYLIDAVRLTGVIKDDSFMYLSLMEEGYVTDDLPHVKMYLLERENLKDFLIRNENKEIN